jgi:hypothetical protein
MATTRLAAHDRSALALVRELLERVAARELAP